MTLVMVYLAVNPFNVVRTLGVAITGSVSGASSVAGISSRAAVSIHGHEVNSTIETTGKLRHVDVELISWLSMLNIWYLSSFSMS